jgi:hypothetical protein
MGKTVWKERIVRELQDKNMFLDIEDKVQKIDLQPSKVHMNKPRISGKLEDALEAFVTSDMTIAKAAETAGLSREHFSRSLRKPHVQERVMQMLRSQLVLHGAKAVESLSRNLNARSEYVQVMAASQLLDRAGFSSKNALGLHRQAGDVTIHIDLS